MRHMNAKRRLDKKFSRRLEHFSSEHLVNFAWNSDGRPNYRPKLQYDDLLHINCENNISQEIGVQK